MPILIGSGQMTIFWYDCIRGEVDESADLPSSHNIDGGGP